MAVIVFYDETSNHDWLKGQKGINAIELILKITERCIGLLRVVSNLDFEIHQTCACINTEQFRFSITLLTKCSFCICMRVHFHNWIGRTDVYIQCFKDVNVSIITSLVTH